MRPPLAGMEIGFNAAEICSDPNHPEFSKEFTLVHLKRFSTGHVTVLKFRASYFKVTAGANRVNIQLVKPLLPFGRGQFRLL